MDVSHLPIVINILIIIGADVSGLPAAPTESLTLRLNCDDWVRELWFNGVRQSLRANKNDHGRSDDYTVPGGTGLIAVYCEDDGRGVFNTEGVLARIYGSSDGRSWDLRTGRDGAEWRCSRTPEHNWQSLEFTRSFPLASDRYVNGHLNYPFIPNMGNARNIWSSGGRHAYCRISYGCIVIHNCNDAFNNRCSGVSDQLCSRCMYSLGPDPHGDEYNAYRLTSGRRECKQLCSWRPDSRICFPGTCDLVESCICSNGYTGYNCDTIQTEPDVASCVATLQTLVDGNVKKRVDADCSLQETLVTYTNERVTHVQGIFHALFLGENFLKPRYIQEYKIGVVAAIFHIQIKRDGVVHQDTTRECINLSRDNPSQTLFFCDSIIPFMDNPEHKDRLTMNYITENGGYAKVINFDLGPNQPREGRTQYYIGRNKSVTNIVVFDFEAPENAGDNWLDIEPQYTRNSEVDVYWEGWMDETSGIKSYELELYHMFLHGDELTYLTPSENINKGSEHSRHTFPLTEPGMYCVVLTVMDSAINDELMGNFVQSRRFIMYDDNTNITIREPFDMTVIIASENTSHRWVTDLYDSFDVRWKGRFANKYHVEHHLLAAIGDHTNQADVIHETTVGQPPLVRSREAIPNVHGVIGFDYQVRRDREGGRTIMEPTGEWITVPDFKSESVTFDHERDDGDSIRVFVRAYDVMNNSIQDSVLVHVDNSPPIIDNFLIRTTENSSLFNIEKLEFQALDFDSGLHELHCQIRETENPDVILEEILLQPLISKLCLADDCYKTPMGDNFFYNFTFKPTAELGNLYKDYQSNYTFTITATNNAQLVTRFIYDIEIPGTSRIVKQETNRLQSWMIGLMIGLPLVSLGALSSAFLLFRFKKSANKVETNDNDNSM